MPYITKVPDTVKGATFVLPGAHAIVFVQGVTDAQIAFGYLKTTTPEPPLPDALLLDPDVSPLDPPPPPRLVVPLFAGPAEVEPVPGTPAPPVPQGDAAPAVPGL